MLLKDIAPWRWGGLRHLDEDSRPFESFLHEMDELHKEMNRLFENFWKGYGSENVLAHTWQQEALMPRVDETEDEQAIHIKIELPGMSEQDVDLTLSSGVLTVRGKKEREQEEEHKDFYRKERSFGSFKRVLPIPAEVDESKIEAKFEKGVLHIELPKTEEARSKIKHIPVKAA